MLNFNGIEKDYLTVDVSEARPGNGERRFEYTKVPGLAGGVQGLESIDVKYLKVPINVFYKDFEELQKIKEDMTDWLIQDGARPLFFTDEVDRTYYASFEGIVMFEEEDLRVAKGTLEFSCADPYKYGPEEIATIADGLASFYYPGHVEGLPVFELEVLEPTTNLDIFTGGQGFRLGIPETVETVPVEQTELVASYPMTSLSGWTTVSSLDEGYVSGTMTASAKGFSADTYGAAITPANYQGPARRRALPSPVQDFRIQADVEFLNGVQPTGLLEIRCLDASGNVVVKFGLEDMWKDIARIQAIMDIGPLSTGPNPKRLLKKRIQASYPSAWNKFYGTIRMNRVGNVFRPYFALINKTTGRHEWVYSDFTYTVADPASVALNPIVEIIVSDRVWPATAASETHIRDLEIFRYNNNVPGIPIIAEVGDKIVVDSRESVVYINGVVRKDLKAFGLPYPRLQKGLNQISVEPAAKFSGIAKYRGRYH